MSFRIEKKRQKLGMSPTTARHRLIKKLLFERIENKCFRCGKPMSLKNLSIEHEDGWDSYETFMDTSKVSFSHHKCNSWAGTLKAHK